MDWSFGVEHNKSSLNFMIVNDKLNLRVYGKNK